MERCVTCNLSSQSQILFLHLGRGYCGPWRGLSLVICLVRVKFCFSISVGSIVVHGDVCVLYWLYFSVILALFIFCFVAWMLIVWVAHVFTCVWLGVCDSYVCLYVYVGVEAVTVLIETVIWIILENRQVFTTESVAHCDIIKIIEQYVWLLWFLFDITSARWKYVCAME